MAVFDGAASNGAAGNWATTEKRIRHGGDFEERHAAEQARKGPSTVTGTYQNSFHRHGILLQ